ncbi:MAG TPA: SMP-30/gluconolactonase/LRE family protein, partial [Dehalococcoidia bacterium]
MRQAEVWFRGLSFGEGPRWHDGRLWLSDFYRHAVLAVDAAGRAEIAAEVPNQPSGLGWLPDGRLLIVSMIDRKLLRLESGRSVEHADLGAVAAFHCNDMVVDDRGRAYVGNFGFDSGAYVAEHGAASLFEEPGPPTATLARVDPDGSVHAAAEGMRFPNGSVITADGRTLIVAETYARRLSAFAVADDGTLSQQRVWATLDGVAPDGICLDAEGAIWVANARAAECIRVAEGGAILDRVATSQRCFACALGGPNRTTLFLVTAPGSGADAATVRLGAI